MKTSVTIRVINPLVEGISKTNGKPWKSLEVIVAWTEKGADGYDHENVQLVSLHGESCDKFLAMNVTTGTQMVVDLAFSTRQYNGKVYNDNRMYV